MRTQIRQTVTMVSSIVIVFLLLLLTGCAQDNEMIILETENPVLTGQEVMTGQGEEKSVEAKTEAPWEKVRYDYSYLETGVEQANQYLKHQKLTLEDLKQLHDLVNTVFGEYPTKIFDNWEERNIDIFDKDLFGHEMSRRAVYDAILGDFHPDANTPGHQYHLYDGKGIYLVLDHIGEEDGVLGIPFKVWGNAGSDEWLYWLLAIQRTDDKNNPWKIYEISSMTEVLGMAPKLYEKDWMPNIPPIDQIKDMQSQYWKSNPNLTGQVWEYYNGQRDRYPVNS